MYVALISKLCFFIIQFKIETYLSGGICFTIILTLRWIYSVDLFQQDKLSSVGNLIYRLAFLNILLSKRVSFFYFESSATLFFVDKISIQIYCSK